ncbi:MAG: NRDE family protein [Acidobacteriota bacterium]|nr:NRDE family protein [Acidobacteriota bacterium]
MCVIFISYNQRSDFPLILAANRDEFYNRPTAPAAYWEDFPFVYGGRDLVAKGTWLGVTDSGRFAAVTNYRDMSQPKGIRSRGDLVADFLQTDTPTPEYMELIESRKDEYTGFNLIAGEINREVKELYYYSNRLDSPQRLEEGLYGISNHLLDTHWPKVVRGKSQFGQIISANEIEKDLLFELLADKSIAPDEDLPDTGVGLERERLLSPIFIETPIYGTRSSTVLTIDGGFRPVLDEKVFR